MENLFIRPLNAEYVSQLTQSFEGLGVEVGQIGASVWGRPIEVFKLGSGSMKVLYVCATHAMEWITGNIMLRFLADLATARREDRSLFGTRTDVILQKSTLHIVPLLNPDGVDIQQGSIGPAHDDYLRLVQYNGGSGDFHRWQANANGVDLNHNFDAGFEEGARREQEMGIYGPGPTRYGGTAPFTEPETQAIRDYILAQNFSRLYALHTQGEEIYYDFMGYSPRESLDIGRILSWVSGYTLSQPEGIASVRGLKDWFIKTFDRPGFTLELGRGTNPLPLSDAPAIYAKIGEMLALSTIL